MNILYSAFDSLVVSKTLRNASDTSTLREVGDPSSVIPADDRLSVVFLEQHRQTYFEEYFCYSSVK